MLISLRKKKRSLNLSSFVFLVHGVVSMGIVTLFLEPTSNGATTPEDAVSQAEIGNFLQMPQYSFQNTHSFIR